MNVASMNPLRLFQLRTPLQQVLHAASEGWLYLRQVPERRWMKPAFTRERCRPS